MLNSHTLTYGSSNPHPTLLLSIYFTGGTGSHHRKCVPIAEDPAVYWRHSLLDRHMDSLYVVETAWCVLIFKNWKTTLPSFWNKGGKRRDLWKTVGVTVMMIPQKVGVQMLPSVCWCPSNNSRHSIIWSRLRIPRRSIWLAMPGFLTQCRAGGEAMWALDLHWQSRQGKVTRISTHLQGLTGWESLPNRRWRGRQKWSAGCWMPDSPK